MCSVSLKTSYCTALLGLLVMVWDDKMPSWCDDVRWMAQGLWCSIWLLLTFWQHVKRRIICFWTTADGRQQKLWKVKLKKRGGYCNKLIWHRFFKGISISRSTSQRQKPEAHGVSSLTRHTVIPQTQQSGIVQSQEGKQGSVQAPTKVKEEGCIKSFMAEFRNTSVKQLLLPSSIQV